MTLLFAERPTLLAMCAPAENPVSIRAERTENKKNDVRRLGSALDRRRISARTDILHFAASNHEFYKDNLFIYAHTYFRRWRFFR